MTVVKLDPVANHPTGMLQGLEPLPMGTLLLERSDHPLDHAVLFRRVRRDEHLPTEEWYASLGDNTLADAILDRLMHNAHRLPLKGESMRKRRSELTQSEQSS